MALYTFTNKAHKLLIESGIQEYIEKNFDRFYSEFIEQIPEANRPTEANLGKALSLEFADYLIVQIADKKDNCKEFEPFKEWVVINGYKPSMASSLLYIGLYNAIILTGKLMEQNEKGEFLPLDILELSKKD
jgi:hypothetical protein